jgi:hypothetical protein
LLDLGEMQFLHDDLPLINCDKLHLDAIPKLHANFVNDLDVNKILSAVSGKSAGRQLQLDYPRMTIHISNLGKYQSLKLFTTYVRQFRNLQNQYGNLELILLELCTQMTFFYGLEILHKIYAEADPSMILCQDSDTPIIYLNRNGDLLELYFLKNYVCVSEHTQTSVFKFRTCIIINFTLEREENIFTATLAKMYWCKDCNYLII